MALGGFFNAYLATLPQTDDGKAKRLAEQQARQARIAAETAAANKSLADARAAAQAHKDSLSKYESRLTGDPWGLSEASRNWKNIYRDDSIDPTKYSRFDYKEAGSGIRTSSDALVSGFDQAFLAGLGFVKPLSNLPIPEAEQRLLGPGPNGVGVGGLGGAAASATYSNISDGLQRDIDFNNQLEKFRQDYRTLTTDKYYLDAFEQVGIDPTKIKTRADLDAISADKKASVYDVVQRTKQAQNQLPPQGIAQSLGGFGGLIGPILGGLVGGPIGGALIGAAQGAFQPGGGLSLIDAAAGGAKGAGIGNLIAKGIPQLGIDPIATSGVPAGVNPLDYTPGLKGAVAPNTPTPGLAPGSVGTATTPGGNTGQVFAPPGGSGNVTLPGGTIPNDQGGVDIIVPGGVVPSGPIETDPGAPIDAPSGNAGLGAILPGSAGLTGDDGPLQIAPTGTGSGSGSGSGSASTEPSPGVDIPDIPSISPPAAPGLTDSGNGPGVDWMTSANRLRFADRGLGRGRTIGVGNATPWWSLGAAA